MEQGLLFDGIDVRGAEARIDQRVVRTAAVFADAAITALPVVDHAFAGAKLALDLLVGQLVVEARLDGEAGIGLHGAQTRKRKRLKKYPAIHRVTPPLGRSASDRWSPTRGRPRWQCKPVRASFLATASSLFPRACVRGSASPCNRAPPGRAPPSGRYRATTIAAYRKVRPHIGRSGRRRWSGGPCAESAGAC